MFLCFYVVQLADKQTSIKNRAILQPKGISHVTVSSIHNTVQLALSR